MLRVDKCPDMTNWLTLSFEPDPHYSPDAGTGLLSSISYTLQRRILLRRENPTYRYWAPVTAATRGFKMVLFTASRGTTLSEINALYRVPLVFIIVSYRMTTITLRSAQYTHLTRWSLTNRAMLVCKVVEVWQDFLSEYVDKKFTYICYRRLIRHELIYYGSKNCVIYNS